jgi:hypothetical protein
MTAASEFQDILRLIGRAQEEKHGFRPTLLTDDRDAASDDPVDRRALRAFCAQRDAARRLER